jgi:DNA-binding IclR family transcriptional regulator
MITINSVDNDPTSVSNGEDNYEYIVPAVDRAARILSLLKGHAHGMTITEVTEATGWHKSSVHKLLVTLTHHGLLDRNQITKRYSLGIRLVEYGQFVLGKIDLRQEARSFLELLAEYSGETSNYCIRRGDKVVIADSVECRDALRVTPPIGTMDPIIAKSNGKAILAFLPDKQVDRILYREGLPAFTKRSVTSPETFRIELAKIRNQGYATDFEEFQEGVSAVSAPLINGDRHIMGTLSVVGPSFRMTRDKMKLYGTKCSEAAKSFSSHIRSQ